MLGGFAVGRIWDQAGGRDYFLQTPSRRERCLETKGKGGSCSNCWLQRRDLGGGAGLLSLRGRMLKVYTTVQTRKDAFRAQTHHSRGTGSVNFFHWKLLR